MSHWIAALKPQTAAVSAASSPGTLGEAAQVLGPDVVQWAVQLAARISDDIAAVAHSDPALRLTQVERPACEASLLVVLSSLAPAGRPLLGAPAEAVEHVRLAVRQGATIDNVLRIVWMSHTAVQDALLSAISQAVAPEGIVEEVRLLSRQLLAFVDLLVKELSACYEEERAVWQNRLTITRRQVLDEILTSGRASEGAEEVLGVRLTRHHMAGIVWTSEPGGPAAGHGPLVAYIQRVTESTGACGVLTLERQDGGTAVVWSYAVADSTLVRRIEEVARPGAVSLALGPQAAGVAGFRESVLGAQQMLEFGRRRGEPAAWVYDDLALAALLTAGGESAGRFVRRVLDGLTGTDARSAAIRDTLRSYLEHGRSRQAAAQELSLAANTVAYRVRQAERSLRRPATERATDTVVALLLARECPWLLVPDVVAEH
jgi:hypothetical protein